MRVVSLLPSATEIVCSLGLADQLVGVSHSCDFPALVRKLPKMTSTRVPYQQSSRAIDEFVRSHLQGNSALYELDMPALVAAAPDVIVSQTLCDVCAVSSGDVLATLDSLPSRPRLIDLEPNTLDDVFADCLRVGQELSQEKSASDLVRDLRHRRETVARRTSLLPMDDRPRVAFLEWLNPPFNGGHWNPELVELAGGIDVLGNPATASESLDWKQVAASKPDILFIACCGYSIERAWADIHALSGSADWAQMPAVNRGNVFLTDGSAYFSRPGPRLLDGLEIMANALHPQVHPQSPHGLCWRISDYTAPCASGARAESGQ